MGNLHITVSVRELPPVEGPSEPVIAREAPAEAGESDEDWETVSVSEGVVATQRPAQPAFGGHASARANFLPTAGLVYPVLRVPSASQLADRRNRVYIVWDVPGRDWSGIHVGRGTLPWRQIRSHAVATQPGWRRAFGCSAEQLRGAFERESQGHSVRWWIRL